MSKHFGSKGSVKSFLNDMSKFRVTFMLSLFSFSIAFIDVIAVIFNVFVMIWGVYLLFKKGFVLKSFLSIKFISLISLFIGSNAVTMFLHIKDNFFVNLVYLIYSMLCFFLFYGMSSYDSLGKIQKELVVLFKLIIYISTALLIISPITLFIPSDFLQKFNYEIGIYREERFSGIYVNPNLLGFSSTVSLIMNFSIFKKKIFSRWFSCLSIVLNFLGLFLSDSNASLLFLIIYFCVLFFCKMFSFNRTFGIGKIIKKSGILLLVCSGLVVCSFMARKDCQNVVSDVFSNADKFSLDIDNQSSYSDDEEHVGIGRKLGQKRYKDVSSGRIDLLVQGLKIFRRHPIMGIGRGNLVDYGNIYLENGLRFPDLHNGYLTVLVSSGIVGFSIFFIFGICVAHELFSFVFNKKNKSIDRIYYHILSAICGYCVYALFEKTILTEVTFMTLFFWAMLGYAMSFAVKYTHE